MITKGSGLFSIERYNVEDIKSQFETSETPEAQTIKTLYSALYLKIILKSADKKQPIMIRFSTDKPMDLRIGLLQVVLAPRIERR